MSTAGTEQTGGISAVQSRSAAPRGRSGRWAAVVHLAIKVLAPVPSSRRRWRSRAAATTSRTRAELVAAGPRRAAASGRWTSMTRSMRSSNGPLSRRRWRRSSASPQLQLSSVPAPHGHGLVAATSMNASGTDRPLAAHDLTRPSSSGWRRASDRTRTPRARRGTAHQGGRVWPRPAAASSLRRPTPRTRSCGGRPKGAVRDQPLGVEPATLWMRVTSTASSRVSSGRIDGGRRRHRLSGAGGPTMEQVVTAGCRHLEGQERAAWPRTSAMSGGRRDQGRGTVAAVWAGAGRQRSWGEEGVERRPSVGTPSTSTPSTSAASGRVLARHHESLRSPRPLAPGGRYRDRAVYRAQGTAERELATDRAGRANHSGGTWSARGE